MFFVDNNLLGVSEAFLKENYWYLIYIHGGNTFFLISEILMCE